MNQQHKDLDKKSLHFQPFFFVPSDQAQNVWATVEWEKRDSKIGSAKGGTVFEMKEVEVPKGWSQLATDIVASKYFRKAGVTNDRGHEYSVTHLIHRVAHTIVNRGLAEGYFASQEAATAYENDLKWLLLHQYGAFNSPVWFNVGLFHEYKIKGSGDNYAWVGEDHYHKIENQYERPQGSACFIQSVEDDLANIFELASNEARLFKYGSGTGSNMSKLRGCNEKLSGGGQSSGLLSFLKVLDAAAGAIKSGGTTRRAAVMRCLDVDHPEVMEFIDWKVNEENKAQILIRSGFDSDFNGEAYGTVSGQNSNNSIRLPDEFMDAVEKDGDWSLYNRTDGSVYKTYKARFVFQKICEATWRCADPGLQYDSTINSWHTCPNSAPIRASNPCSEFMFVDDSACNLASLNLDKFFAEGRFDVEAYTQACRIFLLAQDILVDLSSYPTKRIAKNSHDFRPLGLGYANLGTMLMMAGHPYDSKEGRALAGLVTALMTGAAFEMSAEMAQALEPFNHFAENREPMLHVMKKHRNSVDKEDYWVEGHKLIMELHKAAVGVWDRVLEKGGQAGFRNAQVSVLAPTGTIGLLMDCATTGVEPAYSLVMWKKLAGGGVIPMVNQSVPFVLFRMGYSASEIEAIKEYIEKNNTIEGAPGLKAEHLPIFDCAIAGGHGKRTIAASGHVGMMAAVQPFLSGAISKTINMPNDATVDDIKAVYLESWKLGLKAVAIYRDGSKGSQPLTTSPDQADKQDQETIDYLKKELTLLQERLVEKRAVKSLDWGNSKKLPSCRSGRTWEFKVAGTKVFLRSGENEDGTLGEIFVDLGYKEGSTVRALMNQFAISISFSLQHGVPLEKLVDRFAFTKFEPHGRVEGHPYLKNATSLIDAIFRVLGYQYLGRTDFLHIKPGEAGAAGGSHMVSAEPVKVKAQVAETHSERTQDHLMPCSECGGIDFLRTGTCYVCITCGSSQGCS
ncbi:MAG: ribonucleoside-diphosphate reductase, adenosylcobalamin-dependent [Candidatus Lambdaproteobacteria bacterium RIFOXYD2_FULL_56_26]|uniref:Vitamin B12-dependent ribonucleotide reductase n=1 Tax=Candidatus Lambdaproteobacteria bacterium RIFOXYD2_FULL_56_26 TaxID=1817773 RepID=A0A1F6GNQ7_9PROT|nr:MAG: ribonucleoside-diphosphate reductase, adenosylcobalamin-dependent [Candidatus Lambdaproteobacteria bacterium RIFOXYD2_FULL_56_26]OGG99906.1 MAG: ribonucleoside-diphosphate reductase, adenosylcobalamin-dependent [Candidatus Lambdaproteobacteria bacterium RIFOXYC1_FULL_56_13]